MHRAALLPLLALAACGAPAAPPPPTTGQRARAAIDGAMTAYATCVYGAAKRLVSAATPAGDTVDAAVAACAAGRAALVAKVRGFQLLNAPATKAGYADAVAEQSVAAMANDLRAEATTIAVSRQTELGAK